MNLSPQTRGHQADNKRGTFVHEWRRISAARFEFSAIVALQTGLIVINHHGRGLPPGCFKIPRPGERVSLIVSRIHLHIGMVVLSVEIAIILPTRHWWKSVEVEAQGQSPAIFNACKKGKQQRRAQRCFLKPLMERPKVPHLTVLESSDRKMFVRRYGVCGVFPCKLCRRATLLLKFKSRFSNVSR